MGLNPNRSLPGAASNSTGYLINRSLRFRNSAPAYLSRTYGAPTNRYIWTYSAWVKRGLLGVNNGGSSYGLFGCATSGDNTVGFNGSDQLILQGLIAGVASFNLTTTQVFRDTSAWYHIVIAFDLTQATASNRVKIYVNGSQVTSFSTATYPTQNGAWNYNTAVVHALGSYYPTAGAWNFDGYFADVYWVDGLQLTPSSFGQMSTIGVWRPIKYMGAFGNNGFYLPFSDTTSATTLCYDKSGRGNNWTPTGISTTAGVTYDSMTDVPTLTGDRAASYCVMNPLDTNNGGANVILKNGNLNLTNTNGSSLWDIKRGTMAIPVSGKYYWEATVVSVTGLASGLQIGIIDDQNNITDEVIYNGVYGYGYRSNGNKGNNGSQPAYGASYTNGDVIGVLCDADAGSIEFYKNNVSQGVAYTGVPYSTRFMYPAINFYTGYSIEVNANFGQRPFSYTPPAGFKALNAFNLPIPTIPAGNKFMDATLYTGNGTSQSITNAGSFQPDFVWIKDRTTTNSSGLYDAVRGVNLRLISNLTNAEDTSSGVSAFNSNGFSVGSAANYNTNTNNYVGWQWQAGKGVTSTDSNGSISSTVSVNPTAGFSIVSWTGTAANATVGHGLGVAPKFVIVKNRTSGTYSWPVWHTSLTSGQYVCYLNLTAAQVLASITFTAAPTSSVLSLGSSNESNAATSMIAYCWAEIPGFSKFGSYTGNGSADGPFIYCGFKPAFIMWKQTNTTQNWAIWTPEAAGNGIPSNNNFYLCPNLSIAQDTTQIVDTLSNGFKHRDSGSFGNASGGTYIYAAFAENPFKYANAR